MRSAAAIAMAIGALAAFDAVAQEERAVTSLIAAARAQVEQQCELGRRRLSSGTLPSEKEQAAVLVKMHCDCLPAELARAETDLAGGNAEATTTRAAFTSRLQTALNSCTARLVRSDLASRCADGSEDLPGVADRKAYCGCLSEKLNALDDQTIATVAATKYRNFRDKVQASIDGEPEPVPIPTVVDGFELACKQANR